MVLWELYDFPSSNDVYIAMERSTILIFDKTFHFEWAIFNKELLNCQRVYDFNMDWSMKHGCFLEILHSFKDWNAGKPGETGRFIKENEQYMISSHF